MMIAAFPLSWPKNFGRFADREKGSFRATLAGALKNVQDSIRLFAKDSEVELAGLVISSNCTLGVTRPADPGVAVWFTWGGMQVCIPVDRYATVEANLQAIHHIIEARRVELRHGTLELVRASFSGFLALPAPGPDDANHWSAVLAVDRGASTSEIRAAMQIARLRAHPDKSTGSPEAFKRVMEAWQQVCIEHGIPE
ncbi:Chaperone protein DnaJ [Dyella sp. AD56]|uniref:DnaJ domain-containing protein n=1 Tax=Dyella sp. AD56 TaxID=1528744 RepID=UPI000C82338E|nr:DnaJ domain-containing protein [Dyella sp. AD56]PMQ04209.1 Chaperone protein DnaJ [Dyella sp. AD56]